VSPQLAECLFAIYGVAGLDIIEAFSNQSVDLFGSVIFTKVACDQVMIDGTVQEVIS